MKETKTEHYMQVQRRKTIKYGENQHHQDYITIPSQLSKTLGLEPGQAMKCTLNGNGNSLTYTRIMERPSSTTMKYEEWRDIVKKVTPVEGEGKTYEQIRREGNIPIRTAPAIWVGFAENDIGLIRKHDPKNHRTLWSLNPERSRPPKGKPSLKDTKLTDIL